jgi:hypothetical protein
MRIKAYYSWLVGQAPKPIIPAPLTRLGLGAWQSASYSFRAPLMPKVPPKGFSIDMTRGSRQRLGCKIVG